MRSVWGGAPFGGRAGLGSTWIRFKIAHVDL